MHYAVLYLGLEGKGGEQLSGGMVEHFSLHTYIHTYKHYELFTYKHYELFTLNIQGPARYVLRRGRCR